MQDTELRTMINSGIKGRTMKEDKTVVRDGDKWEFNEEVAACFDNMLERSIPQYELMRKLVAAIGFKYVQLGSAVVDIGCSNGGAIRPFVTTFGGDIDYLLLDVSEPMLEKCRERFGSLDIRNYNIVNGIPEIDASVVLSILTLQFTPIEYRQKIVQSVYDNLRPGGAFLVVEKVLGNTYEIDEVLVDEYYKMKSANAYTQEQIQSKRKSLEGVLVPVTAKWNEDLLTGAGFRKVDCFWRCLNFAGWIAVK